MPYRVAETTDLETRAELAYDVDDPSRLSPIQKAFSVAAAGLATAVGTAMVGLPILAGGVLAVTGALTVWRWRRANDAMHFLFAVERGELIVTQGLKSVVRTRLVDLRDVSLDTKTIQRVIAGSSPTPVITSTNLSPEIDLSRIVLTFANREPITLTDAYLANMNVIEWAGKIRSFLRENGWVPNDERDLAPE